MHKYTLLTICTDTLVITIIIIIMKVMMMTIIIIIPAWRRSLSHSLYFYTICSQLEMRVHTFKKQIKMLTIMLGTNIPKAKTKQNNLTFCSFLHLTMDNVSMKANLMLLIHSFLYRKTMHIIYTSISIVQKHMKLTYTALK